jgi:hypothetical protein
MLAQPFGSTSANIAQKGYLLRFPVEAEYFLTSPGLPNRINKIGLTKHSQTCRILRTPS